jgi:hypothetical protein
MPSAIALTFRADMLCRKSCSIPIFSRLVEIPVIAKFFLKLVLPFRQQITVCVIHDSDVKPFGLKTLFVGQIRFDFEVTTIGG